MHFDICTLDADSLSPKRNVVKQRKGTPALYLIIICSPVQHFESLACRFISSEAACTDPRARTRRVLHRGLVPLMHAGCRTGAHRFAGEVDCYAPAVLDAIGGIGLPARVRG